MNPLNDDESTNNICDHCQEQIEKCDCDIFCGECEDGMPRRHKCADTPNFCDFCKEHIEECECGRDED
jgi:hypothetical protein